MDCSICERFDINRSIRLCPECKELPEQEKQIKIKTLVFKANIEERIESYVRNA